MVQHSISCSGYVSQTYITREKQFCHKIQAGDYCYFNLLLTATTEANGNSSSTATGSAPASITAGMIAAIAIMLLLLYLHYYAIMLLYYCYFGSRGHSSKVADWGPLKKTSAEFW